MSESQGNNDIAAFVEHLRQDPKLLEATWNRPQGRPAPIDEAVDYAIALASERGFTFSREELVEFVRGALPGITEANDGPGSGIKLTVGALGFSRVLVGLSNPSDVMCQYHAPLAVLADKALPSNPSA